jgi:hypothetical protein
MMSSRALAIVLLLGITALGAGCSDDESSPPVTTRPPFTSSSSSSSTSSTTSSSSSTSSSSASSSRDDRSTITTNGGTVVVRRGAGDSLEVVDLSAKEGWEATQQAPSPDALDVTFTRPGSKVEVSIRLTSSGITSSTRSVSTG